MPYRSRQGGPSNEAWHFVLIVLASVGAFFVGASVTKFLFNACT